MAKIQIWLRDDERDLVHRALSYLTERTEYAASKLNEGYIDNFSHRFTSARLADVAKHFSPKDAA